MSLRFASSVLGLALGIVSGCSGGPAPSAEMDAAAAHCTSDRDCDDGRFCNGAEICAPDASTADARGCAIGVAPCAASSCVENAHTCVEGCVDADQDGSPAASCGGDDCDDADAASFPGRMEVCDPGQHDEDCDPSTFGVRDQDGDGEPDATCCNVGADGTSRCGTDCDDTRASVHPSAAEVCNGRDDDCDGATDEGVQQMLARDHDHDGHGDPADVRMDLCAPEGEYTATLVDDCDDTSASIYPGAREICNALDDDCSSGGGADAAEDADGDGHTSSTFTGCEQTPSSFARDDCDDGEPLAHPGAAFQDVPYGCSPRVPCLSGTSWVCGVRLPGDVRCEAMVTDGSGPTWDYDCDRSATREAPVPSGDAACDSACGPRSTCGACTGVSGMVACTMPLVDTPFPITQAAACGGAVTYRTCAAGACGSCASSTSVGRQRCR
ncbi:MAG: putative metal-binding motif-containing protein [Sandaracinus sp.]